MPGRKDLTTRVWRAQAARVKQRDGHQCQACGSVEDLTVDHINPVAATGTTDYADHELITLCRPCNSRKGARTDARLDYRNPTWS